MAYAQTSRRRAGRKPAALPRKSGTWKLAYADFLTALCAFFLIMWVVNGLSEEDRSELAVQFGSEGTVAAVDMRALDLAEALRADPALSQYEGSVRVSYTALSVRIDLTDMANAPLFEIGDGQLNSRGQTLVSLAGHAIKTLDLPVTIEGHTDAHPSETPGYSNWELSAERANAARRLLLEGGVASDRIKAVIGLAETRPLVSDNPYLPANRRISILLSFTAAK
ncbi:MAG: OmpA family protein [Pseudomonadota bacterium]